MGLEEEVVPELGGAGWQSQRGLGEVQSPVRVDEWLGWYRSRCWERTCHRTSSESSLLQGWRGIVLLAVGAGSLARCNEMRWTFLAAGRMAAGRITLCLG